MEINVNENMNKDKGKRARREYPLNFKTMFGVSTMGWVDQGAMSFMTSLFMIYLTDYAGIGTLAATLGTILLFTGRIIDAVDDPLQGWIMDSTKPTKWGRYKPYVLISIILTTISIICLYSLPQAITDNPVFIIIWVISFYLMYDIGASFFAHDPLKATLSSKDNIRSKLSMWPRVIGMFVSVPFAFFIAMTEGLDANIGNMKKSFSLMTLIIMIPVTIVSIIGILLVKEGPHSETEKGRSNVTLKDITHLVKTNKPWLINTLAGLVNGFVWTLIFATTTYYIKWAYSADIGTGIVDGAKFGLYTMIMGALQMLPLVIGAFLAPVLIKKMGDPMKVIKLSLWMVVIPALITFILQLVGILGMSPILYFTLLGFTMLGIGIGFVPTNLIGLECMDYGYYRTNREMSGLVASVGKFIMKAQIALSSAVVGVILVAIGYIVDSETDTYIGELSAIPGMLNWFIVVSALVPVILSLLTLLIFKFYPITPQIREEMKAELERRKMEE